MSFVPASYRPIEVPEVLLNADPRQQTTTPGYNQGNWPTSTRSDYNIPRAGSGARTDKTYSRILNSWMLNELQRASDRSGDQGYFSNRMMGADADADAMWRAAQNRIMGYYIPQAEGGPTNGTFSYQDYQAPLDYQAPTFQFNEQDPMPEEYGNWFQRMQGSGLTGNTTEGDLTKFSDPNFYLNALDPNNPYAKLLRPDEVASPDFDGQFRQYMDAANSRLRRTLGEGIDTLTSSAAGSGRLKTGFFDRDVGDFSRALAEQEREAVGRGAIDVLGLQAGDADSRRRFALDRGQSALDALNFSLRAGQSAADSAFRSADQARANRGELRDLYTGDRDFTESRFRDRRDTARRDFETDRAYTEDRYRDRRDTGRRNYETDRGFAYDQFQNDRTDAYNRRDFGLGAWQWLVGAGEQRSADAYGRNEDQLNRYYDTLFGMGDRAANAKAAGDANRSNLWGDILKAGTLAATLL